MSSSDGNCLKRAASDDEDDGVEPSAKRKRTQENSSTSSGGEGPVDIDFSALEEGPADLVKIDQLVNGLLQQLEHVQQQPASSSSDASSNVVNLEALSRGLLLLRSWQRELIQQSFNSEKQRQEQCQAQQRQEKTWRASQYETNHLQREIAIVQDFAMPHLDQVLQQHRQQQQSGGASSQSQELEPNNPSHRTAILKHLHSEIQERSTLEKERSRLQQKLATVQQKCQHEQAKLKQLPKQLATLEAATKPLQQWFDLPYIGSARSERLKLAQQLPAPLYTLFVTLQEHLDLVNAPPLHNAQPTQQERPKMSLRIVPSMGSTIHVPNNGDKGRPHEVQWSLPVLDVATLSKTASTASTSTTRGTNSKRSVTIHFATPPTNNSGPRCIQTHVSGCPSALDQKWLLTQLFPNEDGTSSTDSSPSFQQQQQGGGGGGGFYPWCHYLAGIHLVPAAGGSSGGPSVASTRAIVQTLQRRIRANATLKYILQSLQQHKIPAAPNRQSSSPSPTSSPAWQVASFLPQPQPPTENRNGVRSTVHSPIVTYDVHCKKTISKQNVLELRATVEIDKAQYPSVPPRWQLSAAPKPTAATTPTERPLYNGTWTRLEQSVNQTLLLSLTNTTNETERTTTKEEDNEEDEEDSKPRAVAKSNGQDEDVEMTDASTANEPPSSAATAEESEDALLFAEWVLVHQLNKLLDDWEQVATAAASAGVGSRAVRGRDRVPISLVDQQAQESHT